MTVYHTSPGDWSWGTSVKLTPGIKLTSNDILVWFDVITEDELADTIKRHGRPGYLLSTAHETTVLDNCNFDHWPCYLLETILDLDLNAVNYDQLPVEYCANFLINKKQINRYLLLKLVEWFNLPSYNYTWSGFGDSMDLTRILSDFNQISDGLIHDLSKFKSHILTPVSTIPSKFIPGPSSDSASNFSFNNTETMSYYWNAFAGKLVSQSAVSLISESIKYEKYMVHTEKTLYSVYGLTFPIWIGGYKQAEIWANKGFDTFNDVINHDYQYCDTLLERCTRAFTDNIKILTDLDFAREQKNKHLDRLHKNRDLLMPTINEIDHNFWQRAPVELVNARPKDKIY